MQFNVEFPHLECSHHSISSFQNKRKSASFHLGPDLMKAFGALIVCTGQRHICYIY